MTAPNEITPRHLLRLIGTPDCPRIFDVCIEEDFADDPYLIPDSERCHHTDIQHNISDLNGVSCVIVCQKGKKLSQGVTAWLRSEGVVAEYLSGGMFAWRDTPNAPRIPFKAVPRQNDGTTVWVTRHRPKIDRIACPWLIRRFVDRKARFLFVAPSEVLPVADRFGATPFDIEGEYWSHRGAFCTFDTMIEEFGLQTEPLRRMAEVIRAADTNHAETAPEAAGLHAISVGLSRQYRDDAVQLEAGMAIYDALYRWARDGYEETHDWPTAKT